MPEAGGLNKSALHWDMLCDMRQGEIVVDGEAVYRNGRFILDL
jgi:aminopeptidase